MFDTVVFNEDTETVESEIAEDTEECNMFVFFDEFALSSISRW